jgi:hypothetical protein
VITTQDATAAQTRKIRIFNGLAYNTALSYLGAMAAADQKFAGFAPALIYWKCFVKRGDNQGVARHILTGIKSAICDMLPELGARTLIVIWTP